VWIERADSYEDSGYFLKLSPKVLAGGSQRRFDGGSRRTFSKVLDEGSQGHAGPAGEVAEGAGEVRDGGLLLERELRGRLAERAVEEDRVVAEAVLAAWRV
jgi:hypothetical protein